MSPSFRACALLSLTISLLFLSACKGNTVDRGSTPFVDPAPAKSYVDKTSVPSPDSNPSPTANQPEPPVINASESGFTPPPDNYTENATISVHEQMVFVGRDVVKLWVWSERGSQPLLMAEGGSVRVAEMGIDVKVGPISHEDGGKTVVYINGKASRALERRQETKVGDTWIFVSDFFLNAKQ